MIAWKLRSLYLLVLFSVAGNSVQQAIGAALKQVNGFKLVQKSTYAGLLNVQMCAQGTRIDAEQSGFVFLIQKNQITVLNPTSRKYCTVPVASWEPPHSMAYLMKGDGFMDLRKVKVESSKGGPLKTEIVTLKSIRRFAGPPKNHREGLIVTEAKAVVTSSLPAGPEAWKVCAMLIGLPDLGGYPLSERYTNRLALGKEDFHTRSLMKAKVGLEDFSVPSGYKQVHRLEEVYLGADSGASFKDMIEGL